MKKAGIHFSDKWKLSIFKKVLNEGGYEFEQVDTLNAVKGTLLLLVKFEDGEDNKITDIVAVANNRAAKSKSKRWN